MLLLLPLPPYQIEWEPILVHVAHAEGQRFPYEVILRSVLKHLVDAASNEFLFLCDFFKTQPKDTFNRYIYTMHYCTILYSAILTIHYPLLYHTYYLNTTTLCERIFGRTMSLVLESIENYLLSCADVVGLLIMIKVRHTPILLPT